MIVTHTGVYHWSPAPSPSAATGATPQRIFDRLLPSDGTMAIDALQVVNGGMSDDGAWHFITALSSRAASNHPIGGGVRGHLHIYNTELRASQPEIVSFFTSFAVCESKSLSIITATA